ncbi:hypothetical protein [uncultured Kordia sp.]|uniref:hypothetical protein n=1 Tax=uncultured Kordia sp. TaxID=507699 RepID=UPI00262A49A7|nr:hypothetical protein [uncultured Kordia sp.]
MLKQLPFLLVMCALLSQPIIQTYSILSDSNIEVADFDFEDDTEEEAEDASEDEKVTQDSIHFILATNDLSLYNSHFYVQKSNLLHSIEILIPPPEMV